jgi:hypothetical protein
LAERARWLAVLAFVWAVGGCGGTSQLPGARSTSTPAVTAAADPYLSELNAEQAKLAAAERRIPTRPRTPAALSRSIGLLQAAIAQLGNDLETIRPPAAVASYHAQLVFTVNAYAAQLARVAATAARPDGELRAANMLLSSTNAASARFSATVAKIDAVLKR